MYHVVGHAATTKVCWAHHSGEGAQLPDLHAAAIGQCKRQRPQTLLPRQPRYLLVPCLHQVSECMQHRYMHKWFVSTACTLSKPPALHPHRLSSLPETLDYLCIYLCCIHS